MKPNIVFWYDFASTYSYLTAMRVDAAAERAGVTVDWRPFLLGPIFKSQGWTTSPFNIYPAKGRYMVRDITRIAAERGLRFQMPEVFPANGLPAARLAIAAGPLGATAAFSRAVFEAQFARGEAIADDGVLDACLAAAGIDPGFVKPLAGEAQVKSDLRHNTEAAQALGIFGAPSFTTADGELFWGDDRLEAALRWATTRRDAAAAERSDSA